MDTFTFTVYGIPAPQGSMKAFIPRGWSRPVLTSDNKKTKPWRQEVAGSAVTAMQQSNFERRDRSLPISVVVSFVFQKPKSTKKSVVHKTTKPDVDKLARAILDALTGIVFEDDSQVVDLHVSKCFGDVPCAKIEISA
jgi:crossover junction endodeoxyribonuclease RusA